MLCVYRVARELEIRMRHGKRSASGQGGHLWFFFSAVIHAYKAELVNRFVGKKQ